MAPPSPRSFWSPLALAMVLLAAASNARASGLSSQQTLIPHADFLVRGIMRVEGADGGETHRAPTVENLVEGAMRVEGSDDGGEAHRDEQKDLPQSSPGLWEEAGDTLDAMAGRSHTKSAGSTGLLLVLCVFGLVSLIVWCALNSTMHKDEERAMEAKLLGPKAQCLDEKRAAETVKPEVRARELLRLSVKCREVPALEAAIQEADSIFGADFGGEKLLTQAKELLAEQRKSMTYVERMEAKAQLRRAMGTRQQVELETTIGQAEAVGLSARDTADARKVLAELSGGAVFASSAQADAAAKASSATSVIPATQAAPEAAVSESTDLRVKLPSAPSLLPPKEAPADRTPAGQLSTERAAPLSALPAAKESVTVVPEAAPTMVPLGELLAASHCNILIIGASGSGRSALMDFLSGLSIVEGVQPRDLKADCACGLRNTRASPRSMAGEAAVYEIRACDSTFALFDAAAAGDGIARRMDCVVFVVNGTTARLQPGAEEEFRSKVALLPAQLRSKALILHTFVDGQARCKLPSSATDFIGASPPRFFLDNPIAHLRGYKGGDTDIHRALTATDWDDQDDDEGKVLTRSIKKGAKAMTDLLLQAKEWSVLANVSAATSNIREEKSAAADQHHAEQEVRQREEEAARAKVLEEEAAAATRLLEEEEATAAAVEASRRREEKEAARAKVLEEEAAAAERQREEEEAAAAALEASRRLEEEEAARARFLAEEIASANRRREEEEVAAAALEASRRREEEEATKAKFLEQEAAAAKRQREEEEAAMAVVEASQRREEEEAGARAKALEEEVAEASRQREEEEAIATAAAARRQQDEEEAARSKALEEAAAADSLRAEEESARRREEEDASRARILEEEAKQREAEEKAVRDKMLQEKQEEEDAAIKRREDEEARRCYEEEKARQSEAEQEAARAQLAQEEAARSRHERDVETARASLRAAAASCRRLELEAAVSKAEHLALPSDDEALAEASRVLGRELEKDRAKKMLESASRAGERTSPGSRTSELQALIDHALSIGVAEGDLSLKMARQALSLEERKARQAATLEEAKVRLQAAIASPERDALRDAIARATAAGLPQVDALLVEARRVVAELSAPPPSRFKLATGAPPASAPELSSRSAAPSLEAGAPPRVGAVSMPMSMRNLSTGPVLEEMDLAGFQVWRSSNPGEIAHVKGFGGRNVSSCYNTAALWDLWSAPVLAWDGQAQEDTGFTALVTAFLREKPRRKAVAFLQKSRDSAAMELFRSSWLSRASEFPGRMIVVSIDADIDFEALGLGAEISRIADWPQEVQRRYVLGRAAMKASASRKVVALGGDGIVAKEAEASIADGVQWTIYALSRGKKEEEPSLMDWAWAKKARALNLKFIYWKDPNYADAFAGVAPSLSAIEVLDLAGFARWREANPGEVVHLKGFTTGTRNCYNDEALDLLGKCPLIAWDGDPPDATGFTSLLGPFLRGNPARKAVAFRKSDNVDMFMTSWQAQLPEFSSRIVLVKVDAVKDVASFGLNSELSRVCKAPRWGQEAYLLSRVALKATGSKNVVALGGGAQLGQEAEASFEEGVSWTVFFVSRGSRREQQESIMDWAISNGSSNLTSVYGKDPVYGADFVEQNAPKK